MSTWARAAQPIYLDTSAYPHALKALTMIYQAIRPTDVYQFRGKSNIYATGYQVIGIGAGIEYQLLE